MVYTRIVQPGQRKKYAYTPGETLFFRISGTVIPMVWRMSLLTAVVTWLACLTYDPLRRGHKSDTLLHSEKVMMNIFKDMERLLTYLTGFITFILGFFNSIVFHRWWKMRELCGNIVESSQNTALHVAVFFVKEPQGTEDGRAALRDARRHLVRLLGLAHALSLQACHRVRDHNWLVERRLLERDGAEHRALQGLVGPGYNEVYGWYIAASYSYASKGMIDDKVSASVLYLMRWALCNASNCAEDLMMHVNQQIPLAYCHLLELMVTLYCLIAPMALVPALLWVAIIVAPIVTVFFYGFFTLGTSMLMDPFQQESGFDTNSFLDSNLLSMESIEQNVPISYAKLHSPDIHRRTDNASTTSGGDRCCGGPS